MSWQLFLVQKKSALVEKWFDLALREYPPEAVRFFKQERDRFANPIGHTLHRALVDLYEELTGGSDREKIRAALGSIVRIRATQGLQPSRALNFILDLKKLLRDELTGDVQAGRVSSAELSEMDARVDAMALEAFDLYLDCRERILEIRLNEVKNRTYRLLQRANLVAGETEG